MSRATLEERVALEAQVAALLTNSNGCNRFAYKGVIP
jgi:hypothetical protein